MSSLEVLNLADNNLSGSIPSSLTKLNFLSGFDVSYNNLSGDIPKGGQFSTFSNEDFEGNAALCPLRTASYHQAVQSEDEDEHHDMDTAKQVTYIMLEVGFAFGLLMLCECTVFREALEDCIF
jgi:Leucine-rich repeat (LRR) protein